jgi:hypothetical protein
VKRFERSRCGIDDPIERDAVRRVEAALANAVMRGVRRRDDLAYPIRSRHHRSLAPRLGEAFASPPRDVGTDDLVRGEPDVDLGEYPPAARTASAVVIVEGTADESAEGSLYATVLGERRRRSHDHARR